jgi:hypothetical protein
MPALALDAALATDLGMKKKHFDAIPTSRSHGIHFRYNGVGPELGMASLAGMLPGSGARPTSDKSNVLRQLHSVPTDSWEIELCVGLAVRLAVIPNWEAVKSLGRTLLILKVHKDPPLCELFFMPRDDVLATYKERMPRALEWVHLYDPSAEIVFWAELYKPSTGRRAGGGARSSHLTDELCGGFGSRLSLTGHVLREDKLAETVAHHGPHSARPSPLHSCTSHSDVCAVCAVQVAHLESTEAEVEERAAAASDRLEKNRAKKARQKAKKADERAVKEEEDRAAKEQEEADLVESLRAAKIERPAALANVDWGAMRQKPTTTTTP